MARTVSGIAGGPAAGCAPAALIYFFAWLTVLFLATGWVLAAALAGLVCSLCFAVGLRPVLKALAAGAVFAALMAGINLLFNERGETVLWETAWFGGKKFTLDSLFASLVHAGRILGAVALAAALHRMVRPDALAAWVSRFLPQSGTLLMLILSALPRLLADKERIAEAWRLRDGRPKGAFSLLASLPFWKALFAASLEGSLTTAASLHARGFGTGKRTTIRETRWQPFDFFLAATSLLAACAVAAEFFGVHPTAVAAPIFLLALAPASGFLCGQNGSEKTLPVSP